MTMPRITRKGRPQWPVPSQEELEAQLNSYPLACKAERLARLAFIWSEFGPPADGLHWGGVRAYFCIRGLKEAFVDGQFLAAILLAHAYIERSLAGMLDTREADASVRRDFSGLVSDALAAEEIDHHLAEGFQWLDRLRLSYVQSHGATDLESYLNRLDEAGQLNPESLLEADARAAIEVVVDLLRATARNAGRPDEPPDTGE